MSDHLPECLLRSPRDLKPESDCICDRLRAAEQRGFDAGYQHQHEVVDLVLRSPGYARDRVIAAIDGVEKP